MINRYTSRIQRLDKSFLNKRLENAIQYDRIAGYFNSSILEIAGESIDKIKGQIRVVCNSSLSIEDVRTASAANNALRREWCEIEPEKRYATVPDRLIKLYNLIKSGKLIIKVIPNDIFGLIHGKAGVITMADGSKTSFIGSINESYSGWKVNYELLWEDTSKEGVDWVQEEFDFFWNNAHAIQLSDFVISDIKRIANRKVMKIDDWRKEPEPASTIVETPLYRREFGLWEHQKYFINLAFNAHRNDGARYVLADMVGLGKTLQLALSAQLMAMVGDKPILILAPKTLLFQWQEEMKDLLNMPSAIWTGKGWVDENGIEHPAVGDKDIKKCPRRVGIVSQGLITAQSDVIYHLLNMQYECVIIDEAHRARRKNLGKGKENQRADPNNLMNFALEISKRTKSMLLATATPVQLHPIEAWDLLNILAQGSDKVLGNRYSKWRTNPEKALDLVMGKDSLSDDIMDNWEWLRNPFPPASEDIVNFGRIRERLDLKDDEYVIQSDKYYELSRPDQRRIERIIEENFIKQHNPFIRHIVRRTREYLENEINPKTNEPYLKKIKVKLFGEKDEEAIILPPYLKRAYNYAEEFSELLNKRVKGGGFLKTLLLKRVGSTMIAGKNTAEKMLNNWGNFIDDDYEEEASINNNEIKDITPEEREALVKFVNTLEINKDEDPKYLLVKKLLLEEKWINRGCIIFSQYFDSVNWIAQKISNDLPDEIIGLYAGGNKSGILRDGIYEHKTKEEIKKMVKFRKIRVLLGTDAASEGLNLQTLGSLINLDLPWNPTRLEQRKGRIQRIGQDYDEIYIYNMRYKDSVEDRVHDILSKRLENIYNLFGQIPDVLEDVWVDVALSNIERAKRRIDSIPQKHPFEIRYRENISPIDWESCAEVLDKVEMHKHLLKGWE